MADGQTIGKLPLAAATLMVGFSIAIRRVGVKEMARWWRALPFRFACRTARTLNSGVAFVVVVHETPEITDVVRPQLRQSLPNLLGNKLRLV
ncbi:MAG: hypothetical protein A2Y76_09415 [Planctomycetes bacterium RBG_13_60_9]|nr:MAG: hypothetical protein A2Y76_09415 [Planctomycetes bacterium RBG_13_60_9]